MGGSYVYDLSLLKIIQITLKVSDNHLLTTARVLI